MPHEAKPILCYVTDRKGLSASRELLAMIRAASSAGVDWIQIREKDLSASALVELVHAAGEAARGSAPRIIVNDRLDVALAAGAAGVHLGEESLPVAEVARWRSALSEKERPRGGFLVGASCHSLAAAAEAEHSGADYVFFGPVFATPSKAAFGPPQGLLKLAEVCRDVKIPVLAIGGVTLENAASCFEAGAAGIAAIRLFQDSPDVQNVVARLRSLGKQFAG